MTIHYDCEIVNAPGMAVALATYQTVGVAVVAYENVGRGDTTNVCVGVGGPET